MWSPESNSGFGKLPKTPASQSCGSFFYALIPNREAIVFYLHRDKQAIKKEFLSELLVDWLQ